MANTEEEFLNKDDEQALRILSLTIFFTNRTCASTADVARTFYPNLDPDSFQKAFRRDRDKMALCGAVVNRVDDLDGSPMWKLDETISLAGQGRLSAQEALELVVATSPMVSDPSFAYGDELKHALAKVGNSFAGLVPTRAHSTTKQPHELKHIRACLEARELCKLAYTTAEGKDTTRIVAPLGFFGLREKIYMVAAQCAEGDDPSCDNPENYRTFLLDRVSEARRIPNTHYSIPADFDIADYIRLPFQIGSKDFEACFFVPSSRIEDIRAQARGHGKWKRVQKGYEWRIPAASMDAAASWATAEGIEPRGPKVLVSTWHKALKEVVAHG